MKNIVYYVRSFGSEVYTAGARVVASMIMLLVLCALPSCNHSELWDDLPAKITSFINQYYPNSELQSVSNSCGRYHVRIDDGPGMTFDQDEQWLAVDGYGMPLPQVLLFDQLPPVVYSYLQETDQLNSVFSISRDHGKYTVTLLDSNLYYDTATGKLTGNGIEKS